MNRTIKDATGKRFYKDNHDQLRIHCINFIAAHNFARRLTIFSEFTPFEYICKVWISNSDQFILSRIHQISELNSRNQQKSVRR